MSITKLTIFVKCFSKYIANVIKIESYIKMLNIYLFGLFRGENKFINFILIKKEESREDGVEDADPCIRFSECR